MSKRGFAHPTLVCGDAVIHDREFQARLRLIQTRVGRLGEQAFEFWRRNGADPVHGGFLGTLDRKGQRAEPTDKGLIQQARHLWAMSMWHGHEGQASEAKSLADGLYRFLVEHFYDSSSREFYFKVSEAGALVDASKVLYAEAFAIYGLAEYALAVTRPEAANFALEVFRAIDERAHDAAHGGYFQVHDAPWLSAGVQKETNTHIHLMEAFTTLYACTADARVGSRLGELLALCADRLLQPNGYVHPDFERDWTPIGAPVVSYGHDLETAWLMLESAGVLGRSRDEKVVAAARAMGENAASTGFDAERGGYFEYGVPGGPVTGRAKIWWVQCEALLGLWKLFELTGNTVQLDRLEATLSFLELQQWDGEYGELYWGIQPDGSITEHGTAKGSLWKTSYHDLRAFVYCERWIEAHLRR
jgi:cellobiose epimerase